MTEDELYKILINTPGVIVIIPMRGNDYKTPLVRIHLPKLTKIINKIIKEQL